MQAPVGRNVPNRVEMTGDCPDEAIALAAYRARRSIGICQYDQPALRVHTAFGKLRIVDASVAYHDHAPRTFVYAIDDVRRALGSSLA
jgi:hypothetical protein